MILTPLLLLATAGFASYNNFYAKDTLNKGVKTKAYIYALNVALMLLSITFFIFYSFDITLFTIDLVLLLVLAAVLRMADLFGMVKGLEEVTPMEMATISSLAITVTYFLDILIGASSFYIFALIAVLMVVAGCVIISKGNTGFSKAKFALILKVTMAVGRGYIGYFILQQINGATYVFFMALIGALILLPFTKKIQPTKLAFKQAFIIQIFGTMTFLFRAWLSGMSATMYMLVTPLALGITIVATYFIKSKEVKKREFIGALIVLAGVLLFGFVQL